MYFNDDFFIINKLAPTRFLKTPEDIAAFRMNTGVSQFEKMLKNNIRLINQHFDKKRCLKGMAGNGLIHPTAVGGD